MMIYSVLIDLDGTPFYKRILGNPTKGIGKRIKRLNDQYLVGRAKDNFTQSRIIRNRTDALTLDCLCKIE